MAKDTDILHEAKRLRLLAAALELQHHTGTAANVVPIPGGDCVIAIGTPAEVRELLEIAPMGGYDKPAGGKPDLVSCQHKSGTTAHWKYVTCHDCGSVKTDGGWGIASNKWFKSEAEADFFRINGRYPDAPREGGKS
jgi:hypothetical protein